jgi:arginase
LDAGTPRRVDLAPARLRELGLVARLGAQDRGDVPGGIYRDFLRPAGRVRNEAEVRDYSFTLARAVGAALEDRTFALVLGGDCSILLGALLGARAAAGGAPGLVYVDGHADFATPQESRSGSAASMCLGLVTGRGDSSLARLDAHAPLAEPSRVALVGRRDFGEPWYGHEALARSEVLDLPAPSLRAEGPAAAVTRVLERILTGRRAAFWVHLDVDVLDPAVMPAVDSPLPDGPGLAELEAFLAPLVLHPAALGMDVTIYDPTLDPDCRAGARLCALLERLLARRQGRIDRPAM